MGWLDRLRRTSQGGRRERSSGDAAAPHLEVQMGPDGATWSYEGTSSDDLSDGNGPAHVEDQFIVLNMLAEQGRARLTEHGFAVSPAEMSALSDDLALLLGLPAFYRDQFDGRMIGNTTSDKFDFFIQAKREVHPEPYSRSGAIITVGHDRYRLTPPLLKALSAVEAFHLIPRNERRKDVDNVRLIATLQDAERDSESFVPYGLEDDEAPDSEVPSAASTWGIDLGHLRQFTTFRPEDIRLVMEPQPDGSLRLWPDPGTGHRPEDLMSTMSSGALEQDSSVIRHGNDLIVLDPAPMEALREITRVGRIPADRVQDFYDSPASFIDQEKVNLDLNFGVRVRSIGTLVPISLAEITGHGLRWVEDVEGLLEPEALLDMAQDEESLAEIESAVAVAEESDAPVAAVQEKLFDVSDRDRVRRVVAKATEQVRRLQATESEKPEQTVQVGIHLHDPGHEEQSLSRRAEAAILSRPVDYSGLKRMPYPHQVEGIEWIARLAESSLDGQIHDASRIQGALLADDMGLGKTFMALTALREFQSMQSGRGLPPAPTLIVLPLTLIENWEAEIESTFSDSPFLDVVVLQSDRDLPLFKYRNAGRESRADIRKLDSSGTLHAEDIRFSLAVGDDAGDDRLDQPGRVVIATYESLASYQLSLGQVDWGMVIFDEAQRIKNPETLAARAAKGLKARFKLVATGTPVENKLMDLWSLMDTAQSGLLGTWAEFRQQWSRPIEAGTPEERHEYGQRLSELIRPFMLRRVKEEHLRNLPEKKIHSGIAGEGLIEDPSLYRTMPTDQATEYLNTMTRHQTRSKTKGGSLKTLQALKSISLHPRAAAASGTDSRGVEWRDGARLSATFEVLDRVRDVEEKAIVFVVNKAVQRHLARWIHARYGLHVDIINGETSALSRGSSSSRRGLVQKFQSRPGFGVIIMSPLAAGTGLTVTEANHAIHLERHWNPAKEAQATDRIYRIGQTKDVHVYLPMAIHPDPGIPSFDVNLHQLLQQKSDLKDAVVVPEIDREDLMRSMAL